MDPVNENTIKTAGEVQAILLNAMAEVVEHPILRMDVGVPEGMSRDPEDAFYTGVLHGLALALTLAKTMGDKAHFTLIEAEELLKRMQAVDHFG